MTGRHATPLRAALMLIGIGAGVTAGARAQVRTIDTGPPAAASTVSACSSDSIITAALATFNGAAAVRVFGGSVQVPAHDTILATYGVYHGSLRIDGTVDRNVVVLDGDARISATGVVGGSITVVGGHLTVDPGAQISGQQRQCADPVMLMTRADGIVALRPDVKSLGARASEVGVDAGPVRLTPHIGIGEYNRVEALPIQLGANATWAPGPADTVRAELYGVLRTARDPNGSRSAFGWHLRSEFAHTGDLPFVIGVEGGSTITATEDRPFSAVESGLSAFLLRRDYNDWYLRRGASIYASVKPTSELTVATSYDVSRETTVLAIDALSLIRTDETWRPNPLIDDGKYHIAALRIEDDARDVRIHPVLQWYTRVEIRHVSSNDLSPVSLPTSIRDAMPATDYGVTEGDFDVRGYLRLNPEQRIAVRFSGGGYLSGDPLTIQDRLAIGGGDPLPGYDFRALNCDRRRKADPALPALCDREMAFQVEYHRALPIDLSTRVGPYTIGIRKPDLVLFGDAGSAWLAGDSAGRVPTGKIQELSEWRSDVGAGVTTTWVGFYLAKSLVDPIGIQVLLLFNARF